MHNTILQSVISKCKNDKLWKNWIGKVPATLLSRAASAPYPHPFFNFSDSLPAIPLRGGNQNLLTPSPPPLPPPGFEHWVSKLNQGQNTTKTTCYK